MPKRHPDRPVLRSCAICRAVQPKATMTRVVRHADGSVGLDPSGKAAGRGTYVCGNRTCREPERLADGLRRALGVTAMPEIVFDEGIHAST